MKKILQGKIKIAANNRIGGRYFHLTLKAPQLARLALPGEFLEVRVSNSYEPLLRRPLSIHKVSGAQIAILYEVLGPATEILAKKKAGDYLDIIGPLGNGFDYRKPKTANRKPILVAGGMGVVPLLFLAERLSKSQVLIGARSKAQILCEKEFQKLGCSVKIATDDGSLGFKGKVTALLEQQLSAVPATKNGGSANYFGGNCQPLTIYACGPRPMLKEVSRISKKYKISAQVSLEEHMGCGIGACLGCAVKTKEGFKRVCKEGPVFNADEIIW